ncbi:penicillin-binding protein activator [Devosia enhydra]|uniref:penicillin-binding protein activator n=1 Tax=Devosia enhydra TaxID=665118 RepID=UPI0011609CB5|nr:penicillin-binding protein activator [Devosia enhydra]
MDSIGRLGRIARIATGIALAGLLAACASVGFGPMMSEGGTTADASALPAVQGRTFGTGPTRVALLLPLSGDPALVSVGSSLSNAAQLGMKFIADSPNLTENITLVLKDSGDTAGGAAQAASQAVAEGASLILGPLRADQVTAVGGVARTAGIPVIGFSNNSGAAAPGVYLLNVLPEVEAKRALSFVHGKGKRAFAGIFPATDFGRIHEGAFRQAAADLGLNARAVYSFSNEAEARALVQQVAPLLQSRQIDTLFLPDRSTAPSFAVMLEEAGVPMGTVQIVGSADWNGDQAIMNTPFLSGALYPAVDETGYQALAGEYRALFGGEPHPLATISYTAVILANASALSQSTPKYDRAALTIAGGFNGRDGVFRFLPDGRSEYALVMKEIAIASARIVDGPKL